MVDENRIRVGVLGATGAVGQRFVAMLEEHPWFELCALAAREASMFFDLYGMEEG